MLASPTLTPLRRYVPAQQAGADAAFEAWPRLKVEAARLAEIAAEEEALRTLVRRMCAKGDLSLDVFGIPESSSDRLRTIIWLMTHGGMGTSKPLIEACSAELFRRRVGRTPLQ